MNPIRLRGGSGLGDSIYLRPIVAHFIKAGGDVTVMSNYPDVFTGMKVVVMPFGRNGINVLAHYSWAKDQKNTTQWEDICHNARLDVLPLEIHWDIMNWPLLDKVLQLAAGRPIVLVHGGRIPMGRTDGFGKEILPDPVAFNAVLDELKDCFLVRIGQAHDRVYSLPSNLDLPSTSVKDLFDMTTISHGIVAQCSFAVPLAETFSKPLLAVWSERGLSSRTTFINSITPQKVLHKPSSWFVQDDWPAHQLKEKAHAFRAVL